MSELGVAIGLLIIFNIILSALNKNFNAICGWTVALLEWLRRLS